MNKRHYEHTLPNIRGSLSNTYDATLIKEEDLLKIMEYNILGLPALVIDEKVVSAGKKLSLAEVKELITK